MKLYKNIAVFVLAFALSGIAQAQDMSFMKEMQKFCMVDAKTYCESDMRNPRKLMQCLADNKSSLATDCQSATEKMMGILDIKPAENAPIEEETSVVDATEEDY